MEQLDTVARLEPYWCSVSTNSEGSSGGSATRRAIVRLLAEGGSFTRAELARRIGVSRTAITNTVTPMIEAGIVVEKEGEGRRRSGPSRSGGPGVPLSLEPSAAGAVGIEFAHESVRVAVADIAHAVLAEQEQRLALDHDAREALDSAAGMLRDALDDAGMDHSRILGVGVGVPGPVDQTLGCPTPSSISHSWVGLEVRRELAGRVGLTVLLDNNVNLAALAESVWGAGKSFDHAIYVKVSTGVGAGIILDRRIWRGAVGMAGEIGHMTVDEDGPMCRCGNRGCLEAYVAVPAQLDLMSPVFGSGLSEEKLVELALADDPRCRRMLNDVSRTLGRTLASFCNVVNPQAIILGGEFGAVFGLVEGSVREAIARYALHLAATSVQIVPNSLGDRAGALGGVALVFHETRLTNGMVDLNSPSAPR